MRNIQCSGNMYGEYITLQQIQKRTARKLFCAGETVYLQSSNMHPFGVWQSVCPIKYEGVMPTEEMEFDYTVKNFKCYNCNSELGKYVHFYKKIS